jgi:hypothetical protein
MCILMSWLSASALRAADLLKPPDYEIFVYTCERTSASYKSQNMTVDG